ncbi:UNVERIFIED_CONTAM: hypothetical protein K2H54_077053 [Gekko kuhli]
MSLPGFQRKPEGLLGLALTNGNTGGRDCCPQEADPVADAKFRWEEGQTPPPPRQAGGARQRISGTADKRNMACEDLTRWSKGPSDFLGFS